MTTTPTTSCELYGADLAHIHVDGYGFHWSGAADPILQWFDELGVPPGSRIADLGCGGGEWLQRMSQEGFQTFGVDISASMIRIAKRNAPHTRFQCSSFDEVELPKCAAVTSVGEPLNYLNSGPAMRRTLRRVFTALEPGGVLIFDVRHPASGPVDVQHHHRATDNWFCYARIVEDHRQGKLTRFITTFRRLPSGQYRRDEETHRLQVFPRAEVVEWLRKIGFRVRTRRGYGNYQLTARQSVFICRKPNP